jgi:hypothetical protein
MPLGDRIQTLAVLVAGAYLGLYLFGLVMDVFAPGEMIGFTIGAGVAAAVIAAHAIAAHAIAVHFASERNARSKKPRSNQATQQTPMQ